MNSLRQILLRENLMLSNNPQGTDKGDYKSYVDRFYEQAFQLRRYNDINLLEIGFRHGASLALWSFYSDRWSILGIDNYSDNSLKESPPNIDWISRPNVRTMSGDAYSDQFAATLDSKFDIIIDDGPHSLQSQRDVLRLYLPKLKPNGILVIEDIQSLGRLVFFKFISQIPLDFSARTFDFRSDQKGDDNVLFVVEHRKGHKVLNRFVSFLLAFWGIGYEIWFKFTVMIRSVNSSRH